MTSTSCRAALRQMGQSGDPLTELEQADHVSIAGTTVRMVRPMLEVVAFDRLGPPERREVHRALAAVMTAPHHRADRAWQMAGGAEGPDASVAGAMSALARTASARGDLRLAALAHQRAADFAERRDDRSRALIDALGLWTALGDPLAMRRLLTEAHDDRIEACLARSAALRWLDGDSAAIAELRKAAPQATPEQRPLLDALFADAAVRVRAGAGRDGDGGPRRAPAGARSGA